MKVGPEQFRAASRFIRWCKFNVVGAIGIGVQFAALFLLKGILDFDYLLATGVAVEAAAEGEPVDAGRRRQDQGPQLAQAGRQVALLEQQARRPEAWPGGPRTDPPGRRPGPRRRPPAGQDRRPGRGRSGHFIAAASRPDPDAPR